MPRLFSRSRFARLRSAKMPTLNILLADEQEEVRALTARQLAQAGHRVVAVANGKEAVTAAQQIRFDVALLDEGMSATDGIETARHFRRGKAEASRPRLLLAITANTSVQERERLLAAGFDEVIGKPFGLEALEAIVDRLSRESSIAPSEVETPEEDPIDVLARRVNSDEKLMRKLIASFLRDLPSRMNSLASALKRGSAEQVGSLAHALKGAVSIFGASAARGSAEELQNLGRNGDLSAGRDVFESLKGEVAKLEGKLRRYAQPARPTPRARHGKRRRSAKRRFESRK